jgi:hypothetical protein
MLPLAAFGIVVPAMSKSPLPVTLIVVVPSVIVLPLKNKSLNFF